MGGVIELGSATVTEQEIIDFASQWDPQYFHIDPEQAADSNFGGIIASGIHTLAIFQRLCVHGFFDDYDVIAGRRIAEVQFRRPVRPGTTLTGRVRFDAVEPAGPGRARFLALGTLHDADGELVFSAEMDSLMRSRG